LKALVVNCTLKTSPEKSNTEWSHSTGRAAAAALPAVARALESKPIPAPPSE
jgi:hypothetical protein